MGSSSSTLRAVAIALVAAALFLCAAAAGSAPAFSRPAAGPKHVILISVDGLVPDYYLNPDSYSARVPNLREVLKIGSHSKGVEGVFPTVTYPNHAAAVTGVDPATSGIVANTPFDPLNLSNGGWYWYTEQLRVPAIWDVARDSGLSTGTVYWPVTVGARVDHNFPEYRRVECDDDVKLLRSMATPGLVAAIESQFGTIPGERLNDTIRTNAAVHIIEKHRPNLLLVHLTDLDGAQHRHGPGSREAIETLEKIDEYIGRMREAVAGAGIEPETAWIVISDHGFRRVAWDFNPRVVLASLGHLDLNDNDEVIDWRVDAQTSGGTFALMARDGVQRGTIEEITEWFQRLAANPRFGIARLYTPEDLAKDGAFPESFLAGETGGEFKVGRAVRGPLVTATSTRGMHGYHPSHPDQLASLLLWGKGIRAGEQIPAGRLIDVAPTIARLLGLEMPPVQGKALKEVLTRQVAAADSGKP